MIHQSGDLDLAYLEARAAAENGDEPKRLEILRSLHLRFFTPREIARLLGFPDGRFSFPEDSSRLHRYRVLGNSLNVTVVAHLIRVLVG